MPLSESMTVTWKGVKMAVVYQPPRAGLDAKRREWASSEGWYMTCHDCGNSGTPHPDCSDAIQDAIHHAEGHD